MEGYRSKEGMPVLYVAVTLFDKYLSCVSYKKPYVW